MPETQEQILTLKGFKTDEINFTPGERSMVAWMTTDNVDHEGDVVVPSGVDYSYYVTENPIVMAIHDLGKWPIGQCEWIKSRTNNGFRGLIGKFMFDEDSESDMIWRKVKKRTIRSVSIAFVPTKDMKPNEWGPPTKDELKRNPHWEGARRIIRRCQLMELSVVPIGMNPDALVIAVNKGLQRPITIEEDVMPDPVTPVVETKSGLGHEAANDPNDRPNKDDEESENGTASDAKSAEGIKVGDHVKYDGGCGEVKEFHVSGSHAADSDDEDQGEVDAHDDKPVVKVLHHTQGEDGKCMDSKCMKAFTVDRVSSWTPYGTVEVPDGKGVSQLPPPYPDGVPDPEPDAGRGTLGDNPGGSNTFRRGDAVKIDGDSMKGYGKVMSVHADGDFVPHVNEHCFGTKEMPAARVRRYKAMGDGFVKTEMTTGHMCKHLTKMAGGLPAGKAFEAEPIVTKTATTTVVTTKAKVVDPEFVIAGGKTEQEVLFEQVKSLTPAGIEEIVSKVADKYIGKIR